MDKQFKIGQAQYPHSDENHELSYNNKNNPGHTTTWDLTTQEVINLYMTLGYYITSRMIPGIELPIKPPPPPSPPLGRVEGQGRKKKEMVSVTVMVHTNQRTFELTFDKFSESAITLPMIQDALRHQNNYRFTEDIYDWVLPDGENQLPKDYIIKYSDGDICNVEGKFLNQLEAIKKYVSLNGYKELNKGAIIIPKE